MGMIIGWLKQIASKYDVEIIVEENEYNKPSSLKSKGYAYVKQTVEKVFDYAAAVPFILPAGTDARRFTYNCAAVIRFAQLILIINNMLLFIQKMKTLV